MRVFDVTNKIASGGPSRRTDDGEPCVMVPVAVGLEPGTNR